MSEEEDPWDTRIAATGCAQENEALQLCHADTGDWRQCLKEMAEFRRCWASHHNDDRVHTVGLATSGNGNDYNLTKTVNSKASSR